MRQIIIAIDGPAGSGKTSSAKILAEKLNYIYIDTGAMYRAVTLAWLQKQEEHNLELNDEIMKKILADVEIELKTSEQGQITLLNGVDVSEEIRSAEVNKYVSPISANELVRTSLVEMQRKFGGEKCCVMDGRDIGTTVFPNAELKIYLTASIGARAKRRMLEYDQKGIKDLSFDEIAEQITARDIYDSTRKISPLRKAEDAIEINTSEMTLNEQVEAIYKKAIELISET